MRDYEGDMDYFVKQLEEAGVYPDEFDIRDWVGCTFRELQNMVDRAIIMHTAKEVKDVEKNN